MNIVSGESDICPMCYEKVTHDESFSHELGTEIVINDYCYNCDPMHEKDVNVCVDDLELIYEKNDLRLCTNEDYYFICDANSCLDSIEVEAGMDKILEKLDKLGMLNA